MADLDAGEGPMTDDGPLRRAAQRAKEKRSRHIPSGPAGLDREALAREFQQSTSSAAFRRQHREAKPMSDQLPAVLPSGAITPATPVVPALVADVGESTAWR